MVGDDLRRGSGESAKFPTEVKEVLILVANCLAPLETPEFMRLTSTKESGFYEFATSIFVGFRPNGMKLASELLLE